VNNRDPSGEITTHANEYLTCEALQQENRHDPRNVYYFDRKTYAYCQWVFRSYTRQVVEGLLKIKGGVHFHLTLQDVGCGVIGTAMGVITDGVGAAVVVSSGSGLAAGLGCTGAS
jgi:hypothetical protein